MNVLGVVDVVDGMLRGHLETRVRGRDVPVAA
jgi:hypothetical protein